MEFKAEIKKTFTGPDKLRAVCSVVLDDCFLVKNVRVVEGEKGLFVSLPSRRNVKGEWVEHCFPMTKELRAKLSAAVLEAYRFVRLLHLVNRIPPISILGFNFCLIFLMVSINACKPVSANSSGSIGMITSSAAVKAFIVNEPRDGFVSTIM